jgi:hypothetical protein
MQEELNQALGGLKQAHHRMVRKLMLNPEYRAMTTVETSIAAISGLLASSPDGLHSVAPTEDDDHDCNSLSDDDTSARIVEHNMPRFATAPFVPKAHGGLGQSASIARQIGN